MNANPHNCHARITPDTKVHPEFSVPTLPPPDVTRGSTKAVDVVLEASRAYMVDWQDARERINEEVDRQLALANKIEGPGGESVGGSNGGSSGGRGGRGGDGWGGAGREFRPERCRSGCRRGC